MTNTTNYEDNVPCSAWAGVCARLSAQRFWPRLLPHRSGWDTIAITVLSQNYHHSLVFTNALNTWDFTPNYCWTKLSTSKWIIMARILTLLTELLTSRGFGDRVHFLLWPRHSATQAQVNFKSSMIRIQRIISQSSQLMISEKNLFCTNNMTGQSIFYFCW